MSSQDQSERLVSLAGTLEKKIDEVESLRTTIAREFSKSGQLRVTARAILARTATYKRPPLRTFFSDRTIIVILRVILALIVIGLSAVLVLILAMFQRFPVVPTIGVGVVLLAILAIVISYLFSFKNLWSNFELVLTSGPFYFLSGLLLLIYAFHTQRTHEHPALTFLIAMLGVAIMLFGTGSRAIGAIATAGATLPRVKQTAVAGDGKGSEIVEPEPTAAAEQAFEDTRKLGEAVEAANAKPTEAEKANALPGLVELSKSAVSSADAARKSGAGAVVAAPGRGDWGPLKANAAVAGGAAVLAALFGWGVIVFKKDVAEVFGNYDKYARIRIVACASYEPQCTSAKSVDLDKFSFEDYEIAAYTDSDTRLFTYYGEKAIQLVVFSKDVRDSSYINLRATRRETQDEPPNELIDRDLELRIRVAKLFEGAAEETVDDTVENCLGNDDSCKLSVLSEAVADREDRASSVVYAVNMRDDTQGLVALPVVDGGQQVEFQ